MSDIFLYKPFEFGIVELYLYNNGFDSDPLWFQVEDLAEKMIGTR